MIGDAYFQLRAQIGTGLFSLARIAGEVNAPETLQGSLKAAQERLRQPFQFITLGPPGSGKSTFLNTLFDRKFCGGARQVAIFKHGSEARDTLLTSDTLECQRPHIFLRDFTIIDTPGLEGPGDALVRSLAPFLNDADLLFFVVAAGASAMTDAWPFLRSLGRDTLKRTVFVVWQNDRVSADEVTSAVKRLRQAMLKNLGQACSIFAAAPSDRAAFGKLERWIENEIVFSESRRASIREIGTVAQTMLREVAVNPRATQQALLREADQVDRLRAELAEQQEQSHRQIAGELWTLTQAFNTLRRKGEMQLGKQPILADFLRRGEAWKEDFARAFESEARESLATQIDGVLKRLETDLHEVSTEHLRVLPESMRGVGPIAGPKFPRLEITQTTLETDAPMDGQRSLAEACARAVFLLRFPGLAALGSAVITLGALSAGLFVGESAALAIDACLFGLALALALRRNVIAEFGHNFASKRAALLAALEPRVDAAIDSFYAELAPPLAGRAEALSAELHRQEPLLARIQQLEATFAKIAADLRTDTPRAEPVGEET